MASYNSPYTYHRKLLLLPNDSNTNTTVQTCLYFCNNIQGNDTVSSSSSPPPTGFCPPVCLAICPSICLHSLTAVFPPDNDSPAQPNTPHKNLSPLLISMLIVLASAFLLITFYVIYTKLYFHCYHNYTNNSRAQTRRNQRNNNRRVTGDFQDEEHGPTMVFHPIWYIPTVGLNPTVISSIPIHKYEKGKILEEKDCAVCLAEFEEGEELKILPKCNHAFHVTCIDKWLGSHVTCPLCRAPVVHPNDDHQKAEDSTMTTTTIVVVGGGEGEDVGRDDEDGVENNWEGCLDDKKLEEGNCVEEKDESSSQRWSIERGAASLVSRSLSCSGKMFSSRN